MTKNILGLDIGSYSIKAAELRFGPRGLEVGPCVEIRRSELENPLFAEPPTESSEEEAVTEASQSKNVALAVAEFLAGHDVSTDFIVTSIPSNKVSSRHLQFPFDDLRKLNQAVPFELEEKIPFDLEDILMDWVSVGTKEGSAEVLTVFAPRDTIAERVSFLTDASLSARVLEPEGLVLANLCGLFPSSGTELFMDIGHGKTSLCLVRDGQPIAARSIPTAGRAITEALAKDRHMEIQDAEEFKREHGVFQGPAMDCPFQKTLTVLERLALEIQRFHATLEETFAAGVQHPGRIVLMGGGSHLHQLDRFLTRRTGIPTERLTTEGATCDHELLAAADPLTFGPALALAARGGNQPRTRMNLLQGEFAPTLDFSDLARQHANTLRLAAGVAALAVLWAVASLGLNLYRAGQYEAALAERSERIFPGQSYPVEELVGAMSKAVNEEQRRADFLGVYRGNLSALDLLQEISTRIPAEAGVSFESIEINRNAVNVRGVAKSFEAVDQARKQLEGYEYFERVEVSDIKKETRGTGKRFNLNIQLSEGSP